MNANVVFEWKRLYREGKLKLPGVEAAPTSSTELLPVNVIDLPVAVSRPAQLAADESPSTAGNVPPCICEIEVEIGKRRVRIRGLPLERAESFLQECLK
jgi:transposase